MKVLSVLTSREFQISMAESSVGLIPPRVKIAEEYYLTDLMPENAGVFFKMLENGTCYPFTVHDGDIDLIYAEYTDMMMGYRLNAKKPMIQGSANKIPAAV